jgi:hypothetical protein
MLVEAAASGPGAIIRELVLSTKTSTLGIAQSNGLAPGRRRLTVRDFGSTPDVCRAPACGWNPSAHSGESKTEQVRQCMALEHCLHWLHLEPTHLVCSYPALAVSEQQRTYSIAVINQCTYSIAVSNQCTYSIAVINQCAYSIAVINQCTYSIAVINQCTYSIAVINQRTSWVSDIEAACIALPAATASAFCDPPHWR